MNLSNVYTHLGLLEKINSTNEKIAYLKRNEADADLKEFFRLTFDSRHNFYITPPDVMPAPGGIPDFNPLFLEDFSRRILTGNAARDHLTGILKCVTAEGQIVLARILNRDARCGVNTSTVNKVWPGLAFEFDLMKGESLNDCPSGHPYKCTWSSQKKTISLVGRQASCKLDGRRCVVEKQGGEFQFFSSGGKPMDNLGELAEDLKQFNIPNGSRIDGELKDTDWNSSMSVTASGNTSQTWKLHVFAIVTEDEWFGNVLTPHRELMIRLDLIIGQGSKRITVCEDYGYVTSEANAEELLNRAFEAGHEGLMFKDPDAPYQLRRSHAWLKAKAEETIDVQIVDMEEGTGKNLGRLGAYVVEDSNGIRFNVGIGYKGSLTDAVRQEHWDNRAVMMGLWIEVRQDKVIDKTKIKSRFPRYIRLRTDK